MLELLGNILEAKDNERYRTRDQKSIQNYGSDLLPSYLLSSPAPGQTQLPQSSKVNISIQKQTGQSERYLKPSAKYLTKTDQLQAKCLHRSFQLWPWEGDRITS